MGVVTMVTVAERPELTGRAWDATADVLPEYNNHGDILNVYWPRPTEELPEFQFHLIDAEARFSLARVRCRCGGTAQSPAFRPGSTARSPVALMRAGGTCCERS